jgi:N-formylglutamate deformylase
MTDHTPFLLHAPTHGGTPLILDSPHSGEHYPDDFEHAPPRAVVRQAEDTHVARLYRGAPRFGATLIEAVFPRAYIDANRSLDDLDPAMLARAMAGASRGVAQKRPGHRGSVARCARRRADVRAQAHRREVGRRIDRWYRRTTRRWRPRSTPAPGLRNRVADQLPFDAVGRRRERRRSGRERPDFVLGDRDGTTCAPEFTALVAHAIRGLVTR